MKPLIALISATLLTASLYAQKDKDIPAWGKIDKADLEMKSCDFDKDAEAMVLVDKGEVEYIKGNHYDFSMKMEIRTRIKIFNDKGFELANVNIPYYSDDSYEKMTDIDAVTYNLDATGKIIETKVDKKSFYRKKLDASFSQMSFSFPEVKAGSIIEYRYTIIREHFYQIKPWIFQSWIPTRVSSYNITFPEYFKFVSSSHAGVSKIETKKEEGNGSVYLGGNAIRYKTDVFTYKMKNIPALKVEPYMGARRDYLQRIEFQLSQVIYPNQLPIEFRNTWEKLVTSLFESNTFGDQLKKNLSLGGELELQLTKAKTPLDKMNTIYKYVQSNMKWDESETYWSDDVKSAWNKKTGTSGDINLILINLLRDAKIEVYPVLASTRSHGKVVSAYPMLQQFNCVLAVAIIGDRSYVMDASDRYNPATLIPFDVLGTEAFLIDKEKAQFLTLWDDQALYKNIVSLTGGITEDNIFEGSASVNSYNYARIGRLKTYSEGKEAYATYLKGTPSNIKIEELELENLNTDSVALLQKFSFKIPVENSGEYKYFSLNHFTGLEKNPFLTEQRQSTIDFGYNQSYMMVGSIGIPEGYVFEEIPKNLTMIMSDTSIVYRRLMEVSSGRLNYRVTLDFKRNSYEPEEYEEFREFYKKLYANLSEQIVFKKKATPKP